MFEGQWIGHKHIDAAPGTNPDVVTTLSEVKVIVKPNGRFDMLYNGLPVSGNIAIDGSKATLSATTTMDRGLNRDPAMVEKIYPPMELAGQEDQTIIFTDPKGPDPTPVRLKRIATVP